ncbi:MAG: DHH family phosphoesterase [Myxococcota bacterium]|nr:DHH family phosphoesterase [Myxococcota bacterium]
MGSRIIICDGAEMARLWGRIGSSKDEELLWVPREQESRARPPGFRVLPGGLSEEAIQKLNPALGDEFALAGESPPWLRSAVSLVGRASPGVPVLVLSDTAIADDLPDHPCLRRTGVKTLIRDDIETEFRHLANLHRVVEIRELLQPRERIGILLQPDPDPDGIACGVALRALLARKRSTAPLISFGEIQRPENRAMVEAIGNEVLTISPDELSEFDGLALVDVQPNVFGERLLSRLRSIDVVVDHHPERAGTLATVKDIRPSYGATSTILTEYLRAAQLEVRPKLATALLYGIKSDTQLLGRETSPRDMDAFAFLHAAHSPALLRRIERPALPLEGMRALGRALSRSRVEDGFHVVVLGRVREDVIPQVAELALQAEGAEWAVAVGTVRKELVFSVRNVGHVRAAGEAVRAVVEGLGVGGGHRSMAKGIIPLKAFRKKYGSTDRECVRKALLRAFIRTVREDGD